MNPGRILLRGAELVNPAGSSGRLDILLTDGKIAALGRDLADEEGTLCRDLTGKYVFPAFIDLHVHLREPGQTHKEEISTGVRAALKGGFAVIAAMPNTQPVIDSPELVSWLKEQGVRQGMEILPVAALSVGLAGEKLTAMEDLVEAGAVAFTDDGKTLADSDLMRRALIRCRDLGVPLFQHSEDPRLSADGQVDPGALELFDHPLAPLPASAEEVIVARDIALQHETGGHLHVTHISSAYAADLVAWARRRGQKVTADVTPHHLLLTFRDLSALGSQGKMKPPLRSEEDRLHLIELLEAGIIDCVVTDHAPHSREEKGRRFEDAPFGVIGLETSFPLLYDRLVRRGAFPLRRLVELYTSAPAGLIGQGHRLGRLAPGLPANLVIFDPEQPFTVDDDFFRSKSRNSPFMGWEGRGVIAETWIGGERRETGFGTRDLGFGKRVTSDQ